MVIVFNFQKVNIDSIQILKFELDFCLYHTRELFMFLNSNYNIHELSVYKIHFLIMKFPLVFKYFIKYEIIISTFQWT